MQSSSKFLVSSVTAAVAAALNPGFNAVAQETGEERDEVSLDEIIVTATKREASVQDIPASIQAITQDSLVAMGAKDMEDFTRFVPSINVVKYGSGSTSVVFRGATTGTGGAQQTSSVYLDQISITQTGSQPSIRAVDINRVEALSGPQGTLYGSDAQAGTLRILTNQPVMNQFEAIFDGEVRGGDESDSSDRGSLVFNLPLVEDKLALRIAAYKDRDGGFIDNVYGHTNDTYSADRSDPANNNALAQFGTLDNAASVEENWNEDEVIGGRLHLLWEMNEDWAATLSYHHQESDAGGGNEYDPFVGDLEVVKFTDEWREEEFSMASLLVEGDLGFAQLVGAVSYWEREAYSVVDTTSYVMYWAALYCNTYASDPADLPYYFANPDGSGVVWWGPYCLAPDVDGDFISSYLIPTRDDKLSVEVRLQGGGETIDWLIGGYYEDSFDSYDNQFAMPTNGGHVTSTADSLYADSIALQWFEFYYGGDWDYTGTTNSWDSSQDRDWTQKAIFGETSWHINDNWTLTLGGRYFERDTDARYRLNRPGDVLDNFGRYVANDEDLAFRLANNGAAPSLVGGESQFVPKVSLTYNVNEDMMVYALYTEGVRQGGLNRVRGEPLFGQTYDSDIMANHEIGYRSTFADGRGRLNLTAYHMAWEEYQLRAVDPSYVVCPSGDLSEARPGVCGQPWQTLTQNLGDAHISGLNVTVDYAAGDNWVFGVNYEVMEAETDTNHNLDEGSSSEEFTDTGDVIYEIYKGLRLPITPAYKASTWAEYSQPTNWFGANDLFVRLQWSFTGDSTNMLQPAGLDEPNPQWTNPAYDIGDLRVGLVGEDWQVDLFVNNLTDTRGQYTDSPQPGQWTGGNVAEGRDRSRSFYTNRPREFGVRYMKRWGD
jgi:outer membrane receptor protein involved in Fe transport